MCGIVGIFNQQTVCAELFDSLVHLQHRGQDAAGIMTYADGRFNIKKGKGLVREIFSEGDMHDLPGHIGIAHTRYPTAGSYSAEETQPFWVSHPYGIALAHNGNLVNHEDLTLKLKDEFHRHLNTSNDSEVILNILANGLRSNFQNNHENPDFFDSLKAAVADVMNLCLGSYAIVSVIAGKGLLAFRDPHGIRPLVMGERVEADGKKSFIFASETTMFYHLGYQEVANVKPGELIFIDLKGNIHRHVIKQEKFSPCIFEYIYFARPDAKLDDISVYRARLRMGQNLAHQWRKLYPDCLPDVVIPAPFTSNTAALSFAHELGVRYSEGLYKNPFIGRTFIMPGQEQRKRSVRYKLVPQEMEIRDKKVLILDDSIVRGTTSREIVRMIREHQAKEIYFATTCPPIKFPCFYGIDIPSRQELIASNKTNDEICQYLQVDKLLYQTLDDLQEAVTRRGDHAIDKPCMACLNGCYVTGNIDEAKMQAHELRRKQGAK